MLTVSTVFDYCLSYCKPECLVDASLTVTSSVNNHNPCQHAFTSAYSTCANVLSCLYSNPTLNTFFTYLYYHVPIRLHPVVQCVPLPCCAGRGGVQPLRVRADCRGRAHRAPHCPRRRRPQLDRPEGLLETPGAWLHQRHQPGVQDHGEAARYARRCQSNDDGQRWAGLTSKQRKVNLSKVKPTCDEKLIK